MTGQSFAFLVHLEGPFLQELRLNLNSIKEMRRIGEFGRKDMRPLETDVERVLGSVEPHVERVLGSVEPHLMVTDPPYGVECDPAWRQMGWTGARATGKVENDGEG